MESREVLSCKELAIGYGKIIRKDINLNLEKGQILWVKGDNGAGKSTLTKTLLGQLSPLGGEVKWSVPRESISVLPQTMNISSRFSYTMREILDIYNVSGEYRKMCSSHLEEKKWNESSRGEKQKVLILTRFKKNTKVFILDEPFNHVSQEGIESLRALLCGILKEDETIALIIVSHRHIKGDCFDNAIEVQL